MNILFAASEITPYAKTGGLGDVLATLPAALRSRGHSVSVVLPLYRDLRKRLKNLKLSELTLQIEQGGKNLPARIWQGVARSGVTVFAVERDEFYDRSFLYGTESGDYHDNAARFAFFSKAVVDLALCLEPRPEILHLNDWQTGLVPGLVRAWHAPFKTVLTIHNLAYQGIFPGEDFVQTGLWTDWFQPGTYEYYGRLNLLKGGILQADALTTVSPGYAREIRTPEFGCGLETVLESRSDCLTGILNGIDVQSWNPATDKKVEARFSPGNLKGKKKCKEALLQEFGLKGKSKPLLACISRLVEQKGFGLLLEVLPEFLQKGARFVLLGSGDPAMERAFQDLVRRFPQQAGLEIGFDEKLAHRLEAGADIFLMPSRFEPCGLNQFYSMRYGTVPVVHAVGGLGDSVEQADVGAGTGTGFKFSEFTAGALRATLQEALDAFSNKAAWQAISRNGMCSDFSWSSRVPEYEKIYQDILSS